MIKTEIKLQKEIEEAINGLGFSEYTEIQEKVIPLIQQGNDVIGQAYTGSGKTVAFGVPSLEKISRGKGLQMAILVPTRELCHQVATEMKKFAKFKPVKVVEVYGGVSINPQVESLRTADVMVSTPGRTLDIMSRNGLNLSRIKILVLDEADKMFEMGFVDDVKRIIGAMPKNRQTLMFSATMSKDVLAISNHYMRNPIMVKVKLYVDNSSLAQHYYEVGSREKFSLLVHFLRHEAKGLSLVFCATRHMVDDLNRNLVKQGFRTHALHGGLTQERRNRVMEEVKANKCEVLIASDVAARGIDIKNIGIVINYDIPRTSKDYVHRIGRTARAGCSGRVISILCSQDHENFRRVLEDSLLKIQRMPTPHFQKVMFEIVRKRREYGNREPRQEWSSGRESRRPESSGGRESRRPAWARH